MFKLSFRHISRPGRGRFFLFLFALISLRLVFIARAMFAMLNVTVAALCVSSVQQQCDQSSEH